MEEKRSWGALWTYALFFGITLLTYFITWSLLEQRRDLDAAIFDEVSELNENQIMKVQGYVLAMADGMDKTNLSGMLDSVSIIRTKGEMKALFPPSIYDDIDTADLIQSANGIYIQDDSFVIKIVANTKSFASGKYGIESGNYIYDMTNDDDIFTLEQRLKAEGLATGTNYYVQVQLKDPSGAIDVADEIIITTK